MPLCGEMSLLLYFPPNDVMYHCPFRNHGIFHLSFADPGNWKVLLDDMLCLVQERGMSGPDIQMSSVSRELLFCTEGGGRVR